MNSLTPAPSYYVSSDKSPKVPTISRESQAKKILDSYTCLSYKNGRRSQGKSYGLLLDGRNSCRYPK
jgi:hypothetical protein